MNAQDARSLMLMDVENGIRQMALLGENTYQYKGKLSSEVTIKLHDNGFKIREQNTAQGGIKTIIQW